MFNKKFKKKCKPNFFGKNKKFTLFCWDIQFPWRKTKFLTHALFHYCLSFPNFSNQAMMPFSKISFCASLINTYLNTFQLFHLLLHINLHNQNKFLESFLPNPTHHNLQLILGLQS